RMHASVASLSSSSELLQPVRHPQLLLQPAPRSALPSLASLRMQAPPPFAELASSSSTQQACTSFGASRKSSMSSSNGASSAHNSSRASCSNNGNNNFWKNPILYKTTMCDNWTVKKPCKYGARCWYAHGFGELRFVPRLDQLPEGVRDALFVEPALARAFFQEMTSLDAGYSSAASARGGSSSSSYASRSESRASMTSSSSSSVAGSCRHSMSPASTVSDSPPTNELEALLFSPPLAAAPSSYHHPSDRRANRWAPGAAWAEGAETPRASRVAPATVPLAKPLTTSDYRLFDASHPLAFDLSFLRE
ncbi:hypothetical protein PENTCL1PPCAC_23642, partial [Pristionchus entomophagus]